MQRLREGRKRKGFENWVIKECVSVHRRADELSSINGVNVHTDTHTHSLTNGESKTGSQNTGSGPGRLIKTRQKFSFYLFIYLFSKLYLRRVAAPIFWRLHSVLRHTVSPCLSFQLVTAAASSASQPTLNGLPLGEELQQYRL